MACPFASVVGFTDRIFLSFFSVVRAVLPLTLFIIHAARFFPAFRLDCGFEDNGRAGRITQGNWSLRFDNRASLPGLSFLFILWASAGGIHVSRKPSALFKGNHRRAEFLAPGKLFCKSRPNCLKYLYMYFLCLYYF